MPPKIPGAPKHLDNAGAVKNLERWVKDLLDPELREQALAELSKQREQFPQLAPYLWRSFGTMSVLLQELIVVYPQLQGELDMALSNRVCNALALLQCVASDDETRGLFLDAKIPLFLYPFLNTSSKDRPFEYLRLTALGVIGALVKQDDSSTIINFLLSTEIIPMCLRSMEIGSELSKTVATFITQKILQDDMGLNYVCATPERFYAVITVLQLMLDDLKRGEMSVRQLKHIVRCYLRLADNMRARQALQQHLQHSLLNRAVEWKDDPTKEADSQLEQLLEELRGVLAVSNIDQNVSGLDLRMPNAPSPAVRSGAGGFTTSGARVGMPQAAAGLGPGGGGAMSGAQYGAYPQSAQLGANAPSGAFRRIP